MKWLLWCSKICWMRYKQQQQQRRHKSNAQIDFTPHFFQQRWNLKPTICGCLYSVTCLVQNPLASHLSTFQTTSHSSVSQHWNWV
jgi:hypothetical protein